MRRAAIAVLLLCCGPALSSCRQAEPSQEPLPCWYEAETGETAGDFVSHDGCATLDGAGLPSVAAEHLAVADYDDGLATFFIDGRWFYVRHDGASLGVLAYDNGADMWSSGLVRGRHQGKIKYFDRSLQPAIDTAFDGAWPFEGDHAVVCQGCREAPADGDEHRAIIGGAWGVIDRHGRPVVPIELGRDEALQRLEDLQRLKEVQRLEGLQRLEDL